MHDHLLIDGRLVAGAGLLPVIEPASGQVFAQAPRADAAQVGQAVAAGKRAARDWALVPMERRAATLEALANALQAHAEAFAMMLTREQGKLLDESRGEVEGSIAALRYHAGLRLEPRVLKQSADELVVEQRFPLGVVVAIVPWNYPLLMLILKLAPALLAGNTVIAKPAPTTPLTTLMLGTLAADIFPAGVVQVLGDAGDLGPLLVAHPDVAHISFTGSTATGRKVLSSAAGSLKRVTAELGGNDAALVLDDADVGAIAADLFAGATANAGQVCLGIKRIYAARNKADDLAEALADLARKAVVGDGLAPGSTMGPVQNMAQHRRVLDLAAEASALGRIVGKGSAPAGEGYFIAPTVVRDLPETARLIREEQFGPLIPVQAFDDLDHAIALANAADYALGGSVWSGDVQRAMAVAARLETGLVWVNRVFDLPFDVPLGGARASGMGRHQGIEGVEEFTQTRIVNAALR
ncbi:aldehyde dehydrogenase family protein [Novosphingobium terrae]|uniref:aldehyde dehydrogenase family protein n=1 Tax=Novosphingobium terrae TaxID=2726189 RepID=UPI0019809557|nr:aldehyde dehydrogenase family protein [Novosphingobium terrae]